MCKNKTVFLRSCKSKKRCLISEPLPLVEEVYLPLSASTPVSPLMPVTFSGLMCLLPGSRLHKEVETHSQTYRAQVLGQHIKKRMCLTCPHIFKHSQNNTELMGRRSTLGAAVMLGWINFARKSEKFREKLFLRSWTPETSTAIAVDVRLMSNNRIYFSIRSDNTWTVRKLQVTAASNNCVN